MKKLNYVIVAVLIGLTSITACKKKESATPASTTTTTPSKSWVATVGGTADKGSVVVQSLGGITEISCASSKNSIGITVTTTLAVGTYTLADQFSNANASYASLANPGTSYTTTSDAADQGTLKITKYDATNHLMSGTFSFIAKDQNGLSTVQVTNGSFTDASF